MTMIPAAFARVPNLLASRVSLANMTRASVGLFHVQTQLATGRIINRPSDDAARAAAVAVLDDRLERAEQRLRNLSHADAALSALDQALGDAHELFLEAKTIASAQASVGAGAEERRAQAQVVESLIDSLYRLANRESVAGYMFGGTRTGSPPVEMLHGGFRYLGTGDGLLTDLGPGEGVPITLGAASGIGMTSARVRGSVDLDPALTAATRLADLDGARGLGVTLGTIEFSFDGGARAAIDLSGADTAGDVAAAIEAALREYESDQGVTILGPGGVSFAGGAIAIDVAPGSGGADPALEFFDVGGGVTAQDLGLAGTPPVRFDAASGTGLDTRPRLTWMTPISALEGLAGPLGSIRLNNVGRTAVVDLSGAETLEDVRNLIEGTGLGVRVEINEAGTGIDVLNETAAGRSGAMSIEEVPGSGGTAEALGIRTLTAQTPLAEFNDGRGVRIVDGQVDPTTGQPDAALNVDFRVTLGDGRTFDVDLRPEDVVSVQTLLDRINAEAAGAGIAVPGEFVAELEDGANGIVLRQDAGLGGAIGIESRNNSSAAEDLGLLDGSYDAGSGSFRAEDRAKVRVPGLFTALIDLREALLADDTAGIVLAGEELEAVSGPVLEARALVGARAGRVGAATVRTEDLAVLDEKTRSDLRDLDFAEASVRFAQLQLQLEAAMRSAALVGSRTLLDYLA